jgi:N-acetylneuraminic acid mutarotase
MKVTKNIIRLTSSILMLFGFIVMGSCQNRAASPAARYGARMVYDPVGRQSILFGGRADALIGMKYFDDLWKFDSASLRWSPIRAANHPGPRLSPGMVYDPLNRQIIIFGGDSPHDRLADTWVYSLADNRWQEVTSSVSPPPRSDLGLVYDEQNQVVILFSGYCLDSFREMCDDTWAFDPKTNTWTEMNPASSPPIMYGHTMVYDSINQKIILWGGHESTYKNGELSSHQYGKSIWQYSYQENNWQQVPSINSPPARYWHQTAFDTTNGTMLLFGGNGANAFLSDTWIYDVTNRAWQKVNTNDHPPARINPAMSYDPINESLVLFGGMAEGGTDLEDMWFYKGEWVSVPEFLNR